MIKVFKTIAACIEKLTKLTAVLSGMMIMLMAFIITYSVVMRYAFKNPDPYTYDLASMILLFSVVLTIPWLEKLDQNIRMDMVVSYIPRVTRYIILRVVGPVLAFFYVYVLTWKGWTNAMYSLNIGETSISPWGVPLAPLKFVVPVGYGLLGLILILNIIRGIVGIRNADKIQPDEEQSTAADSNEIQVKE